MDKRVKKYSDTLRFNSGLQLRNRIVLAPLDLRMSLFDGTVSQNDLTFHRTHARHVGMDVVGSAFISASGNTTPGSISVSRDTDVSGLSELAATIHRSGAKAILQLVHAGRLTNYDTTNGAPVMAPSAVMAKRGKVSMPVVMNEQQILTVIDDFVQSVRRAYEAGFDGIELHGANGFLFQQFLSPRTNRRIDKYGGDFDHRAKFIVEVVTAIETWLTDHGVTDFTVGYRLSPEEAGEGGLGLIESMMLAKTLEREGIDYISLSLLDFRQTATSVKNDVPICQLFNELLDIPVIVAGGIHTRKSIINSLLNADLLAVGSSLVLDPEWLGHLNLNRSHEMIKAQTSARKIGISESIFKFL